MSYRAFLGYSSQPELARESLHRASELISQIGIDAKSWEDLAIGGQIIIASVLSAIDESEVSIFDISTLSTNVLYELGYAIGRAKRVWLLIDKTDKEAAARWTRFRLLSSVGYRGWSSSEDIRNMYSADQPHLAESTIYDQLIEPTLTHDPRGAAIFHMPMGHDTDASIAIDGRLNTESRQGVRLITADPNESALNPLTWYAQKVNESAATIVHFSAERRTLAPLRNARAALIAGLATGLERPVLMLAEEDYSPPLDYQDRLEHYRSTDQAYEYLNSWLIEQQIRPDERYRTRRLQLVTQLKGLTFGEHVAENESDSLSDYFMETAAFGQALKSRLMLFVGRKGSGKTANMLQTAARLREDARNVVVVIKPASYDFTALVALMHDLPGEIKDYSIESLWRFLLESELARTVIAGIEARPIGLPYAEAELELIRYADEAPFDIRADFAKRFEEAVTYLQASGASDERSVSAGRDKLNEAMHADAISRLRKLLGPVLSGRERVAILIDNLDKAWIAEQIWNLSPICFLACSVL